MPEVTQVQRVLAILKDLPPLEHKLAADETIDDLARLVDSILECPLEADEEEARLQVCEVLLHLRIHTGDE
jgi:hypothetical protein